MIALTRSLRTPLLFAALAAPLAWAAPSPQAYVDATLASSRAQVAAAQLALKKGQRPALKTFAQMIVDEHAALDKEVQALAQKQKLQVSDSATLSRMAQAQQKRLERSEQFDTDYAQAQAVATKSLAASVQDFANDSLAEPGLKELSQSWAPRLLHQQEAAQQLLDSKAQ
ncbi:MAG: hypothetical protein GAK45_01460 [Pseudomonas citronellolis]|nr:MAG: hypothetical protein GAK45_01460 [Pseudomonas citronellolis]